MEDDKLLNKNSQKIQVKKEDPIKKKRLALALRENLKRRKLLMRQKED